MNKKELAALRKEFKTDTYKLLINDLYSIYVKKDNKAVVHEELHHFEQIDEEMQELYLKNFKKVLSGAVDTKLFELDFDNTDNENNTQGILCSMINSDDRDSIVEGTGKIVEKLMESCSYDTDVMVTIIRAEYMKSVNKKSKEHDEGDDDVVQTFKFLLCSVNKIDMPKRALTFDFKEKEFSINSPNDAIINLSSPLGGFMFPLLYSGEGNVNKVLFNNGKSKEIDRGFIEGVLNCSIKMDAETERNTFTTILQDAIGHAVRPEVIQDIYERINEVAVTYEEEAEESIEPPTIGIGEVKMILEDVGVGNTKELELAFDNYVGSNYDFKVQNIIPDFNSKSIKITSESANITVTPKDLGGIRQVKDKRGRKCLLIELTDDIVIDGFKLETEEEEI